MKLKLFDKKINSVNNSICIIVLNWNGLMDTRACIRSILRNTKPSNKIIVVDNGSNDNEGLILKKEFGNKIQIHLLNKNLGFTGGINFGIEKARKYNPKFFLFLNNDTELEKGSLKSLVETASLDRNVGIVSPLIIDYFNRSKILFSGGGFNWLTAKTYHKMDRPKKTRKSEFITGCAMLVSKELIDKIGNLDDRFFAYFEDAAFSVRANNAGFVNLINPKAIVYHKVTASSSKTGYFYTYLFSRNRILFIKNYTHSLYSLYFNLFFLSKVIIVSLFFLSTNQNNRAQAYIKGYIDGMKGVTGVPRI